MTGILDGACDDHYTLKITMCERSHQPRIGKIQCDRLCESAQQIESNNELADGIHDALADYDRSLHEIARNVARTDDPMELKELIDLDVSILTAVPSCKSILIDQYRVFVQAYMTDSRLQHEQENLMEAIMLMESNMIARGIPVPILSKSLLAWWT